MFLRHHGLDVHGVALARVIVGIAKMESHVRVHLAHLEAYFVAQRRVLRATRGETRWRSVKYSVLQASQFATYIHYLHQYRRYTYVPLHHRCMCTFAQPMLR